jgi:fused signal recognition particle receptor
MGLFDRIKAGLARTRQAIVGGLASILTGGRRVDEALLADLERALLLADVGPKATADLLQAVRDGAKAGRFKDAAGVSPYLQQIIAARLSGEGTALARAASGPTVVLVCGVNGSGKTTSIGKLTAWLKREGHKVVLGAADTFRAAAVEQLTIWSQRNGVEIVKQASGADPAAVAFDACQAGRARGADYVILDTAGRLHTQQNLMEELSKIRRVVAKAVPGAPHEVLLVVDATTGQNAIRQAELFHKTAQVTGLFVSKLDGTAKGGSVIGIRDVVGVPVKFIGVGEQIEDIEPFDATAFAAGLFT